MGVIFESIFIEVLCLLLISVWLLYLYITANHNHWKERGVPYEIPSLPFGTLNDVILAKSTMGECMKKVYEKHENSRYVGIFEGRRPTLLLRDPELIKSVMIKDFNHFYDRFGPPKYGKLHYINNHLFNMHGQEWKQMRTKLTPTFTSGKMKAMFPLMTKCGGLMKDYVDKSMLEKKSSVVDIKDVLVRFTMDIIGSCAFGLDVNSLTNENSEFYNNGIQIFKPSKLFIVQRLIISIIPFIMKIYSPNFLPLDVTEFLRKIVKDTVEYRENNDIKRNDFLDLLIKIRQNKSLVDDEKVANGNADHGYKSTPQEAGMTIEEMTAQSFIFFFAGFETASSTMSFCLYELARNPEVQDKVYKEVVEVMSKHEGQLTYQAVQEMSYMEQVINETLRMYASLSVLQRTCSETYKVPDSDLVLEKGQRIVIPTFAIHMDPKYYPQPGKFDPDRFCPENVKKRHPCLHLPFGDGPRICIGMRFGLLQAKIGLSEMVSNYKFELSAETPVPLALHKTSFITQPEKPILLCLSRRDQQL